MDDGTRADSSNATITIAICRATLGNATNSVIVTSCNISDDSTRKIRVGRAEHPNDESFLSVTHETISQLHCELDFDSDRRDVNTFKVVDRSRNGVLVNGHKLTKNEPTSVHFGDPILIGKKSVDDCVWLKVERQSEIALPEIDETQEFDVTENQESEINAPVSDLIQSQPNVSSSNAVTGSVQTYQNNLVDNIVDTNEANIISVKTAELENSESTDKRAASCNVYSENGQKRQAENKLEDEAPSCSKTAKSDCSSGTDQREEIVKEKSDDTGVKVEETGSDSDGQNMFGCELKCSICTEIFHQPVSLQPCMHTFCGGCYSGWMTKSEKCPSCRHSVEKISKNRLVANLCESYLNTHPQERRHEQDLKQLELLNKVTEDVITQPEVVAGSYEFDWTNQRSSSSSEEEQDLEDEEEVNSDDDEFMEYEDAEPMLLQSRRARERFERISQGRLSNRHSILPVITCLQCPSRQHGLTVPETMRPYTCPATNARHLTCQCCARFMPDRRARVTLSMQGVVAVDAGSAENNEIGSSSSSSASSSNNSSVQQEWLTQMCFKCSKPFCRLYFGTCDSGNRPGCVTCIDYFKEFRFTVHEFNAMLNGNRYESLILQDYLRDREISLADFFVDHILTQLPYMESDSITATSPQPLTADTIICRQCAIRSAGLLCYEYRKRIPEDQLPRTVTNRPNCWYGRNCLTQRTRDHHARNFNHICDQTR
ncbi:E3 ubiquitin-protein ligase CHFR-like isoform X2 [Symsagittifera roscoffensis]|uniref:E3 ubiquitin-protein ligase CHFR-like isoform X2 n=1 Tax=Symsagittifera roscoffensis TaxID=84072 RepID=UPI00307BD176